MPPRAPRPIAIRALVGAMALYGLVLHAFLVAALPVAAAAHDPSICAPGSDNGGGAPHGPASTHHHQCCLPMHGGNALGPVPSSFVWAPQSPAVTALAWTAALVVSAGAPNTHAHSARGPPEA